MSTCINEIPAGLPALPAVPAGWDAWEYMGIAWRDNERPEPWTHFQTSAPGYGWLFDGEFTCDWSGGKNPSGCPDGHYIRAVKLPAKPKAKRSRRMRRESRKLKIATAYQMNRQTNLSAWDFAAQVERIIDNENRKKRRARK